MKKTIALLGQPNSGKSTLFNGLTGSHQHVGNWPGKTVEKMEGSFTFEFTGSTSNAPFTFTAGANRDEKALFVTPKYRKRITTAAVHKLVKKHLSAAGLDSSQYSSHKLRHTAATLMLQNGVDVRTLQEVLGHDHLNTTQIYTHVDNDDLRYAAKANPLSKVKQKKKVRDAIEDATRPIHGESESE